MAKAKNSMGGVSLGRKTAVKKSVIDVDKVEKIVKEIHGGGNKFKMSVMIPKELHKSAKKKAMDLEVTLSDYIADLIEKDISK